MEQILSGILSDFIIAVLAALLTYLFAIQKFRSERWWDLKVTAYQKVIESLHKSKEYCGQYSEVALGVKTLTPEKEAYLKENAIQATQEITKAVDIGTFVISLEALTRLEKYKKDSDDLTSEAGSYHMYDYFDQAYNLTKECLEDLRALAKQDLQKTHL